MELEKEKRKTDKKSSKEDAEKPVAVLGGIAGNL